MGLSILFVVWKFPALAETFILSQITSLIDRGHNVTIYALGGVRADVAQVQPDVERYHLLRRTFSPPALPQTRLARSLLGLALLLANGYRQPSVALRALGWLLPGRRSLSARVLYAAMPLLGRGRYDIIHCQFGPVGLAGQALRALGAFEGRLITSFLGYDVSSYLSRKGDHVYDRLFAGGDLFVVNCEYNKRRLLKLGCDEQRLVVHRCGINLRRFAFVARQFSPASPLRVLTIGRLHEKKGIEYGIRAVAKLLPRYPNLHYDIIGDGPLRQDLQRLIGELRVDNRIRLLGSKNQREVIEHLHLAHLFVAPSVTARDGNQEGIVTTLAEAMATGLPVVSTYHSGIPELVEDGVSGFLVPERDAEALAERLDHLIGHPEVWPRLGRAGRARVEEQYNIDRLADQLVEMYRRVLAQ